MQTTQTRPDASKDISRREFDRVESDDERAYDVPDEAMKPVLAPSSNHLFWLTEDPQFG